jgi:hypothetical protein
MLQAISKNNLCSVHEKSLGTFGGCRSNVFGFAIEGAGPGS